MKSLETLLIEGGQQIGINISPEQTSKLLLYMDLLREWNQKINLTAITEPEEIIVKHFLDSLSIFGVMEIKKGSRLIDVGTGAGFPGLPIKIMLPDLQIVLADALHKRMKFLEEIKEKLYLEGIELVHGRAEDLGKNQQYREVFDYAVSRAVAKLSVLAEYCLPFVKVGGFFISYKGPNIKDELEASAKALGILGGEIKEVIKVQLPLLEGTRNLVVIQKVASTPHKFPRKAGLPEKKPLE